MEGDRRARLILKASLDKKLDYSKFNARDPYHLQHEDIVLQAIEREVYKELHLLRFDRYISDHALTPPGDNKLKLSTDAHKESLDTYKYIVFLCAPWLGIKPDGPAKKITDDEAKDMLKRWELTFGKLNSPEVQAKLMNYALPASQNAPPTARVFN